MAESRINNVPRGTVQAEKSLTDAEIINALETHFHLTDGDLSSLVHKNGAFAWNVARGKSPMTLDDRICLYKALPVRWEWICRGTGSMLSEYSDHLTFAQRVRAYREESGLSLTAFGERIGIAAQNVSKYEAGKMVMKFSTAEAVERRCGISASWLLFGDVRKKGCPVTDEMEAWISGHPSVAEEIRKQAAEYQEWFRAIKRADAEEKSLDRKAAVKEYKARRSERLKEGAKERTESMLAAAGGIVADQRKTQRKVRSGENSSDMSRSLGSGGSGGSRADSSDVGSGMSRCGGMNGCVTYRTRSKSSRTRCDAGCSVGSGGRSAGSEDIDCAARMREIVTEFHLTPEGFGEVIDRSNADVLSLLNGKTRPTDLELEKIMASLPVREKWLLEGSGPMTEDGYDHLTPGQRLKRTREQAGMSMQEFADRIGMAAANYACFERGTLSVSTDMAERIGERLGVSREWLLYGKADRKERAVSRKMCDWLWAHPEERQRIRREMMAGRAPETPENRA